MVIDFAHLSSQYFGNQQIRNMASRLQPAVVEAGCQQKNISLEGSPDSIMSRFESPAPAFYPTERYMRFPQYDCQAGNYFCSQYSKSHDSHQSSGENCINSGEQADLSFGSRSTLESVVRLPQFSYYKSLDKSDKGISSSSEQHNKFLDNRQVSVLQVGNLVLLVLSSK